MATCHMIVIGAITEIVTFGFMVPFDDMRGLTRVIVACRIPTSLPSACNLQARAGDLQGAYLQAACIPFERRLERLSKIAIYMGMGMGTVVFVLVMGTAIPSILESTASQWESGENEKTEDEMHALLAGHPAYKAMYERFPDAREEFSYPGGNNGRMTVGAMNFETNNQMILDVRYEVHRDEIIASVYCYTPPSDDIIDIDELFTEDFIQNTDCLELDNGTRVETGGTVQVPSHGDPASVNPPDSWLAYEDPSGDAVLQYRTNYNNCAVNLNKISSDEPETVFVMEVACETEFERMGSTAAVIDGVTHTYPNSTPSDFLVHTDDFKKCLGIIDYVVDPDDTVDYMEVNFFCDSD